MKITVHAKQKGIHVSDETRDYAVKKLERLNKFFRHEPDVLFIQDQERGLHIVEMTLHGDGIVLRSQERCPDLRACVDSVFAKLETQIKRFMSKRIDGHRHASPAKTNGADESEEEFMPRIVRRKAFPMKSMSAAEAARQMELLGHNFFLFRDEDTDSIGVLYRRESGDYGLIEAEA